MLFDKKELNWEKAVFFESFIAFDDNFPFAVLIIYIWILNKSQKYNLNTFYPFSSSLISSIALINCSMFGDSLFFGLILISFSPETSNILVFILSLLITLTLSLNYTLIMMRLYTMLIIMLKKKKKSQN